MKGEPVEGLFKKSGDAKLPSKTKFLAILGVLSMKQSFRCSFKPTYVVKIDVKLKLFFLFFQIFGDKSEFVRRASCG